MKWFEVKERSAGEKRLILSWYIYKLLGRKSLEMIAFCVAFITFLKSKDLRKCSAETLRIFGIEPSFNNVFTHFLNYAFSQVDKIEVFSNCYDYRKINLVNSEDMYDFKEFTRNKKGCICIFSHLGNIDAVRSLLKVDGTKVTIFLSNNQAKIFRSFLNTISEQSNVAAYAVEDIGISTPIEIKDKLENGEFVFIAGDRISKNSQNRKVELEMFGKKCEFPLGTFKLAELCEMPIFFMVALAKNQGYDLHVKKYIPQKKCAEKMAESFAEFLSEKIKLAPLQFYHFYDFFKD